MNQDPAQRICRINPAAQRELSRIVNRHKARLLSILEQRGCPMNFRESVTDAIDWMRSDLSRLNGIVLPPQTTTKGDAGNERPSRKQQT